MTVRNKLLLTLIAFAAIPLLLIASVRFFTDSAFTRQMYADRLDVVASTAEESFKEIMDECVEMVRLQSTSYNMRQYLSDPSPESAELLRQNFIRYTETLGLIDHFALMDANGKVELSCHIETLGRDLSGIDYFNSHAAHHPDFDDKGNPIPVIYTSPVHDSVTEPGNLEGRHIAISLCIRDNSGNLRYVLAGYINALKLGQIANGMSFGETGIVYVIDSNNYIFNHPEPRFLNTYTVAPQMANLVGRYLSGDMQDSGLIEYVLDGIPRLYYYNILPEYEIAVILRQDLAELQKTQSSDLVLDTVIILFLLVLATITGLFLSKKFSSPISLLRSHILQNKETGKYSLNETKTSGEFRDIIDGYNSLVLHIDKQQTQIYAEKERHNYMVTHDQLTGLLNRGAFEKSFAQQLTENRSVALILLRIGDFKSISDSYGRLIGDLVLIEAGLRMKNSAAGFEVCSRIGNAQYMLCKSGTPEEVIGAFQLFRREFVEPFDIDKAHLHLDINAGIAVYPQDGLLIDMLMSNADIALSQARADAMPYLFYNSKMREAINHISAITEVLRGCVVKNEIFLMYQPIHNLSDDSISGFESLMRIKSSRLGLVSPREFIPVAEKDPGLIISIGNWSLVESCRFLRRLIDQKNFKGFISVNIFSAQLDDDNFVTSVLEAIEDAGISAGRLQLEVTERTLNGFIDKYAPKFAALRAHGVLISLDDFGEIDSSLFFLSRLPLDTVKIDQAFFTDLNNEELIAYMNRTIIELGRHLGISVLAERIENQEDCNMLKSAGYEMAQGYLFDYPLMETNAVELL